MIRVDETIQIHAASADVWARISDYAFDERWRSGLVEMSAIPPGPPVLGTKVREVLRRGGRTYQASTTVEALEPGTSYRFSGQGSSGRISGHRTVEAESGMGLTRFTYAFDLEPTLLLRLLGPIATRIARSSMRRDLQMLKSILEAGPDGASSTIS